VGSSDDLGHIGRGHWRAESLAQKVLRVPGWESLQRAVDHIAKFLVEGDGTKVEGIEPGMTATFIEGTGFGQLQELAAKPMPAEGFLDPQEVDLQLVPGNGAQEATPDDA
jgi:hypothetical protein